MSGGLPLLVTRPEPGNSATMTRATALGLDAHAMPLFAARALPWTAPAPQDFDAILLTSAQAVATGNAWRAPSASARTAERITSPPVRRRCISATSTAVTTKKLMTPNCRKPAQASC